MASFEQLKSGQGMTQDMTQMIGSLDLAKESDGAGEGANGNPDVPGNGNATFLVYCLTRLRLAEFSLGLRMA